MQSSQVEHKPVSNAFNSWKLHFIGKKVVQKKPLADCITPLIQKKESNVVDGDLASDAITSRINSRRGSGRAMDNTTKSYMENRFGTDFSNVRIHTDTNAKQLSQELNAQAFTVGNDIYFNDRKYNATSTSGKHLLAHELTHTIQQRNGTMAFQRKVSVPKRTTLNTRGYNHAKSGRIYSAPKKIKSSLWSEIFTGLLASSSTIYVKGKTTKEVNANFIKHIKARFDVIKFASKMINIGFGAGSRAYVNPRFWSKADPLTIKKGANLSDAISDLFKNAKSYNIACFSAAKLAMLVGSSEDKVALRKISDQKDWIPGDWGNIKNDKFSKGSGSTGLEGENIIYVGKDMFWGHFPGKKYRTYKDWFAEVKSWNGAASLVPERRYPITGVF